VRVTADGRQGGGVTAWLLDAANPEWESALENGVRGCVAWKVGGAGGGWTGVVGAAVGSCIDSRAGHARVGGTTESPPATVGWRRRDSGHERCRMVGAEHTPICLPPACLLAPCLLACTRHPSRPSETLPCKLVNFARTSQTRKFHGVRIQRPSVSLLFSRPLLSRCHLRPSPSRSKGIDHSLPGRLARSPFLAQFLPREANSRPSSSARPFVYVATRIRCNSRESSLPPSARQPLA